MLQLHIEKGQLFNNGNRIDIDQLTLNTKVKEVLRYILTNHIIFDFEKRRQRISFSAIRPDLKRRLLNALMAEKMVRHHGV